MTTNQTIDGVRKLAEQACGTSPGSAEYQRFMAAMNPTLLLDLTSAAAQPQGEPVAWVVQCKTSGLLENAEPGEKATNPRYFTDAFPVFRAAPAIKLHVNVSNVKVTVNADGSYSIDPVAAAQTCCGSCPGGCAIQAATK